MTPLASAIVKQSILPLKKRSIKDTCGLLRKMDEIHCFECTQILPLAAELRHKIAEQGIDERSTFLPAPRTWIEFRQFFNGKDFGFARSESFHRGWLIIENKERTEAEVFAAIALSSGRAFEAGADRGYTILAEVWPEKLNLHYTPPSSDEILADQLDSVSFAKEDLGIIDDEQAARWMDDFVTGPEVALAMLAMINTPRIIGRRQHAPNRNLERKLLRAGVGKYPLLAWTEIKLEVGPPRDVSNDAATETHLTGRKALHFCRSFIRIRLGRLEIVRSHWRGDPALGIKQSRYRLERPNPSGSQH